MSLTKYLPDEPNDHRKQIGVRLTPSVHAQLLELTASHGVSVTALIVALIRKEYVEANA